MEILFRRGRQLKKYKLWLFMLNVSDKERMSLLSIYNNEETIYSKLQEVLDEFPNMKKKLYGYDKIEGLDKSSKLELWMEKNNIGFLSITDSEYPESLINIADPPYGLFYKGNLKLINSDIVALIGSRNSTAYGEHITKILTKELIRFNISIISGGAKGIDTIAHKTALDCKGNTIIVLGCGIDVIYPYQNRSLFKRVEEEGLILSEFPIGTKPLSYNFPRRNRIISGLSKGVIVSEASEKSGSLITVNYALDQGKDVMAVPGSVFSESSRGCNSLIKDGAIMYNSLENLYDMLGLSKRTKNISPLQNRILSLISKSPTHVDEILNKSYVDREALYRVLFEMQIQNEIVSLPGNFYAKVT